MDETLQDTFVKNIMQVMLKARKNFQIYPDANPIRVQALKELHEMLSEYCLSNARLHLKISQYDIYAEDISVYHSSDKQHSLALHFFRDGITDIVFKKGITEMELEDFITIIATDFDNDENNDMATIFWEKNFQYLACTIDDVEYADAEEFQAEAIRSVHQTSTNYSGLANAYEDSEGGVDSESDMPHVSLTDENLEYILKEVQMITEDKLGKLINIHLELLYETDNSADYDDLSNYFINCFDYALDRDNFALVVKTLSTLNKIVSDQSTETAIKKTVQKIIYVLGSHRTMGIIGNMMDKGQSLDREEFQTFIESLGANSVDSLIRLLGNLETIRARKYIIDALASIGKKDITLILRGLKDSQWFVLRNIIYILRQIGDSTALEPVTKMINHEDVRVKKEAFKTIGSLGGARAAHILREYLGDQDIEVRKSVLQAMQEIGSESAKRVVMDHISEKQFIDKSFEEKKFIYSILSKWKDQEVYSFLAASMDQNKLWKKSKHDESRACAAYCLGLLGDTNAVPLLEKHNNSSNKKLRDITRQAIRSLQNAR